MYVLDSGASGLYAAYSPSAWSGYTLVDPKPGTISYGSGASLTYQTASTDVTLLTTSGTPLTIGNADVGLITSAEN